MPVIKFDAVIKFDTNANHPDGPNEKGLEFGDTYRFNTDHYGGDETDMREYIKNDLALVAGGGYETNTITNVKFEIVRG